MRAPAELLSILPRLSEVLKQMTTEEEAKAAAASSGRHEQLDAILTREQALILELRGLEQKRIAMLDQAGLGQASFRQILEQEDADGRERLTPLFDDLTGVSGRLRQAKENADRILNVRLHEIRRFSAGGNAPHYDSYG